MNDLRSPATTRPPLATYCLRHGDRALILAQRLLEWVTHAPEIEEDMAISNLALDLIGQTRAWYTYAGSLEGPTPDGAIRDEDHYAYFRDQHEFLNPLLVERDAPDFAHLIVRQFLHDAYAHALWQALTGSSDATIAALAGKSVKETAYHLRHSRSWFVRLGDGTEESHRRMVDAVDTLYRYYDELFDVDEVETELIAAGVAADLASIRAEVDRVVTDTFAEATLELPTGVVMQRGGRAGHHGERFGYLIGEMQVLARAHPGASW